MAFAHQREVIFDLLAHLLDPKSLAVASCVCKSWNSIAASDHLWKPLCLSQYPSIAGQAAASTVSPRRLFALLYASSTRRHCGPCAPRICLADLIFAVDVFDGSSLVFSVCRPGEELVAVYDGVFRFDVAVEDGGSEGWRLDGRREVRVAWNVVTKGLTGAMLMLDRVAKGGMIGGELSFSEEIRGPACCWRSIRVVAEVGIGFGSERSVEKVNFRLMSSTECRYLTLNEGLLYMQPFLLPSAA